MNEYLIGHFLYKKGRVGRELFEFEELWFSFSWSHFVFSHPNSLIPPWGKEQATLVELWPLKPKDMSTHLTLSGGRENLRLRKLSTGLDVFPPTSRWRKRKWLLHDLPCHVSELFHLCCCLFLIFVFVNSVGERKRFQTESLAWAIRRRDFWFCAGCFIWYWLLFFIYMCFK